MYDLASRLCCGLMSSYTSGSVRARSQRRREWNETLHALQILIRGETPRLAVGAAEFIRTASRFSSCGCGRAGVASRTPAHGIHAHRVAPGRGCRRSAPAFRVANVKNKMKNSQQKHHPRRMQQRGAGVGECIADVIG